MTVIVWIAVAVFLLKLAAAMARQFGWLESTVVSTSPVSLQPSSEGLADGPRVAALIREHACTRQALSKPDSLAAFVQSRMAKQALEEVCSPKILEEAGGLFLFATIGADAYLRPDGSVWYRRDKDLSKEADDHDWAEAKGNDRLAALVLGTKRTPELAALLPTRPPSTPDCSRCSGRGEILASRGLGRGFICPDCGGLGWVFNGAA
jgi:hypothetical protein